MNFWVQDYEKLQNRTSMLKSRLRLGNTGGIIKNRDKAKGVGQRLGLDKSKSR